MEKSGRKQIAAVMVALFLALSGCGRAAPVEEFPAASQEASQAMEVPETAEETEEAEPTAEEPGVTILMAGDILLHDRIEQYARREDGTYDFSSIFSETAQEIRSADLAIVNQEVIIGGEELGVSGYPSFNAPYAIADELAETGFDAVCHATNHVLDRGGTGLLNCIEYWESHYPEIEVLGIHDSREDQDRISLFEENGIRFALLNFTYGTNEIPLPEGMPYAVDLLEEDSVREAIRSARSLADFVIVCPHWGDEYQLSPSDAQLHWVKVFLEENVDLVIGTHPHVIEPVQFFVDAKTGHPMLVYYSLGNFVNWTSDTGEGICNRMAGGMAEVTVGRNAEGEAVITDYTVKALVTHVEAKEDGVRVYFYRDYTEALAGCNRILLQDESFSIGYLRELYDLVWGDLWE